MATPYMTIDDRTFLREVRVQRVYRSLSGCVMRRGPRPGARNDRVERFYRKAVQAGWMHAEPDENGAYQLTEQGHDDLAARELASEVSRAAHGR